MLKKAKAANSAASKRQDAQIFSSPFGGQAIAILEPHRKSLKMPVRLYHYTSSVGLLGIVKNHCLWFSDSSFMNDGSEVMYGLMIFRSVINEFMDGKPAAEVEAANQLYQVVVDQKNIYRQTIFCMSDEGNLLNQWRDYGKDVTAYSVEMDTAKLIEKDAFNFYPALYPLIYDPEKQLDLTRNLFSKIYEIAKATGLDDPQQNETHFAVAAAEVSLLINHFKNPAFAAEKEWRLACNIPANSKDIAPEFRPSNLGVVPYYIWRRSNPGERLPITSVIVGPTPYAQASDIALKMFLSRSGYDVSTHYSTIPIRR